MPNSRAMYVKDSFCDIWNDSQKLGKDFPKFCGPLRIYELYQRLQNSGK